MYKKLFKEYFRKTLTYKSHEIFDTEHSLQRYVDRVSKDTTNYYLLLKKAIDWIIKNKKENIEDRYIFISRKNGFGIQVQWRKDRYSNLLNGYSATTFSNKEMNFFTKADKEVFLENMRKYVKGLDKIFESTKDNYYMYRFENELKKETDLIALDMFIEDNKIYHTYELIKL